MHGVPREIEKNIRKLQQGKGAKGIEIVRGTIKRGSGPIKNWNYPHGNFMVISKEAFVSGIDIFHL